MSDDSKRPILVLLTSHWVSMLGVALVTTAGFSWLFVLPIQLRGHTNNPYIGIVVFIFIPVIFVLGLVLIAFGVFLARRRIASMEKGLLSGAERQARIRKLAIFLGVTSAVNIVTGTQGAYRAVQHMESVQFCGQSCHDETRIHRPSQLAALECGMRGMPRFPGCGWVGGKQEGRHPAVDRHCFPPCPLSNCIGDGE